MSSLLFSSFQGNTKCESSFFADTCTRCVPIFVNALTDAALTIVFMPSKNLLFENLSSTRNLDSKIKRLDDESIFLCRSH